MKTLRVGLGVLGLGTFLCSGAKAQQPDQGSIAGSWVLNVERSDDPQEKLRRAMRPESRPGGVTVRGRGGSSGGRGRGRGAARGTTGVEATEERQEARVAMREVVMGGQTLQIVVTASTVRVQSAEHLLQVHANGKEETIARWGNPEARVKAEWKKAKLVIETEAGDGLNAKEEYELIEKEGVKHLEVIGQLRMPGGNSVRVKRVYDPKP